MKRRFKKILGIITAISLIVQMTFVAAVEAEDYFSIDFEASKVYDLENNLVGETESVAWNETSEPTFYLG